MRRLRLVPQGLTDVGRQREANEDWFGMAEDLGLYVVCDGMGGHASGEVASRLTVDNVLAFVRKHRLNDASVLPYKCDAETRDGALLSNAIQFANDRVYIESMKDSNLEGMGTTVVAVLATEREMIVGHVGDSRIYRWSRTDALEQVTRDHSLLNYKIDRGELRTKEEIAGFKQGNVIVRAVGLKDYVEPEVTVVERRPGDVFLLCSDGLTDLVDDWSIENVLEANWNALGEAAACYVRMANDRGGKDNITVLLLRVDDDPLVPASVAPAFHEEDTDPRQGQVLTVEEREEDTQPTGLKAVTEEEAAAAAAAAGADATAQGAPAKRRRPGPPGRRRAPAETLQLADPVQPRKATQRREPPRPREAQRQKLPSTMPVTRPLGQPGQPSEPPPGATVPLTEALPDQPLPRRRKRPGATIPLTDLVALEPERPARPEAATPFFSAAVPPKLPSADAPVRPMGDRRRTPAATLPLTDAIEHEVLRPARMRADTEEDLLPPEGPARGFDEDDEPVTFGGVEPRAELTRQRLRKAAVSKPPERPKRSKPMPAEDLPSIIIDDSLYD